MCDLMLTDEETDLLVDLLERERSDLPVEIRHTRSSAYRDELRKREDMVDRLLTRFRVPSNT
jgi:hypothetical protein